MRDLWRFAKKHKNAVVLWAVGGGLVLFGLLFLWAATLQLPDLSQLKNRVTEQSVQLYDRTGTVLLYDLHNNLQRTVVPLNQISPNIQNATLAMEDPNFYRHGGISFYAIMRAILIDIAHLGAVQGGSTLTQQVVKTSILNNDKTMARKLKEWILSMKLEQVLTKDQILELYLNQAPYGGSLYGAEAASKQFFGKHAADVSLAEASYLAAVLPAPTYYSPYGNNRSALNARKNLVLQKMYEHGYITTKTRDDAQKEQVEFNPQRAAGIIAPHFVFYVQQYLEQKYGEDALAQGGWKIITTLDADLQVHAEEIVQKRALENVNKFNASNMGLLALDPSSGQILVMVGSRNYFDTQIDGNFNVTLAKRQPGSAFKPFAYAEAFTKGYTPETVLFDVPTQFSTSCAPDNLTNSGGCYSPGNYDNKFRGPMTMREAIAQSINVPSVKVLYLAGLNDTLQLAKSMGISTLGDAGRYGLTLVLGGGEVTLLDITSAYGVFAQDGVRYAPTPVLKIEDQNGNVLEDNTRPIGSQVLDGSTAQKINDILSDNVARAPLGENNYLNFPGRDVAVKTGTTNDYRDGWVVGYSPSFAAGAWAGNNNNSPMVKKVAGLIVAPAWHEFMDYALSKTQPTSFTRAEVDNSNLKPVLHGVWQTPGMDGVIHEILYWVDKNDPRGPEPTNPNNDPQFRLWDPPVQAWAMQNNYYLPVIIAPQEPSQLLPSQVQQMYPMLQ